MYHDKRRCPIATQQSAWHPSRCLATDHARRQCRAHPPVLLRVDTVPSSFLSNSSISWLFPGLRLKKACILSLKAIQEFYHLIAGSTRIWVKEQDCSQKTWYERRKKSKEVMRDQQIGQKHLLLGHAPWVVACLRTVITMPCRSLRCDGASPFVVIHVFSERFTPTLKASSFCLSAMPTKKGTSSMSTETNKALVRRAIEEVWNQGNYPSSTRSHFLPLPTLEHKYRRLQAKDEYDIRSGSL